MSYGPNSALVEEVVAFLEHGGILRPTARVVLPGAHITDDLDEAKTYAWQRQIAGDESPTWTDLREDQAGPFHAVPYEHPERRPAYEATRAQIEPFFKLLRQNLPDSYVDLIDDLAGDLMNCATNRALHGLVEDSFWEQVWRVYRQGAWPCGWEGDHPDGRLVIYQPPLVP